MTGEAVSFSLSAGELTVRDEAGGGEVALCVDDGASITPATDAWFDVPVDDAVSLETASVDVLGATSTELRSDEGEHYGSIVDEPFTVGGGTYVDVSAALKLLLYVEDGPMEGELVGPDYNPEALRLTFEEPTHVVVGARSHHEEPLGTITVTDDPDDLMTAASYLGSSIKEWSAERSWPTLRGHPPAIEGGEERHVPEVLSVPGTDVTVAVPRDTADVLRVTPLAYYFGADVVPGDRAELRLGSQHTEPLGSGAELEDSVDELLAHAVVLDSLVRIGGYYSFPRHEYEELAPELPFYPPELYDEPIHRQLLEYLEVPVETVAPYTPDWPAVATLRPTAADAAAVPYFLDTLSRVHVTEDGRPREQPSTPDGPVEVASDLSVPRRAAALPPTGRERAATHKRRPSGDASVLFVGWERPEPDPFADTDWERFELGGTPTATYCRSVTRAELRSLLTEQYAHVHYGGRLTEAGFVCDDGVLGFDALPAGSVGAISLQWNRRSLEPLTGLFDVATVVCATAESLPLESARELAAYLVVGRSAATSARLAALDGVRFLGDATLSVARRPTGHAPLVHRIERSGPDQYRDVVTLDSDEAHTLGNVLRTRFGHGSNHNHLSGTEEVNEPISAAELAEIVASDAIVRFDWRPASADPPTPSTLDDLLPE